MLGQTYYAINPTANDFQVAATPGGMPVTITERWPHAQFYLRNAGSLCYKKDHTLTNGTPVYWLPFYADDLSVLETGLTSGTVYYVVNANPVTGEFQLALTEGGAPITLLEQAVRGDALQHPVLP